MFMSHNDYYDLKSFSYWSSSFTRQEFDEICLKNSDSLPFMEDLKRDIIAVVKKYTDVTNIEIKKDSSGEVDAISIDVQLS